MQDEVLPVSATMGLGALLGIWTDADEARDHQEIDAALAAARYPRAMRAIVIGNEGLLRRCGAPDPPRARAPPGGLDGGLG